MGRSSPQKMETRQQVIPSHETTLESPQKELLTLYENRRSREFVLNRIYGGNDDILKANLAELMIAIANKGGSEEGYQIFLKTYRLEVSH